MLRNKLIGLGFNIWVWSVRTKSFFKRLGKLRLHGVDHITIPVHDLKVAREFYCELLGGTYLMTVDDETFKKYGRQAAHNSGQGAHHVSVFLGGKTRIDLFLQSQGQAPAHLGHPHYAFEVPPREMLKWKSRLEDARVPTDGPVQLGPPGQASLYFNDPFGNHLEITCMGYSQPIEIRPPSMDKTAWQKIGV